MKAKNKKYNNKKLCKRANAAVIDVVRGFHINRRSGSRSRVQSIRASHNKSRDHQ